MSQMSPLVEYLLAVRRPGGGALCRMGIAQWQAVFPAGAVGVWDVYPEEGTYANITYWFGVSGITPPNVFDVNIYNFGVETSGGLYSDLVIGPQGNSGFAVRTQSNPVRQIIRNISGLNQYDESIEYFLIIDTEADYKTVMGLIDEWNVSAGQRQLQEETNELLRQLVAKA